MVFGLPWDEHLIPVDNARLIIAGSDEISKAYHYTRVILQRAMKTKHTGQLAKIMPERDASEVNASSHPSISSPMFPKPNVVFDGCSFQLGVLTTSACCGSKLSELFLAVLAETMEFWLEDMLDRVLEGRTGFCLAVRSVLKLAPKPSVRFVGKPLFSADEKLLSLGFGFVPPSSIAIAACIGQ